MRLQFSLLVVDDNPDSIKSALDNLRDYLRSLGFILNLRYAEDLSERGVSQLAKKEGKDFDLVLVDYNLGQTDTNGAVAAARVRSRMPYTDIIFYSSNHPNLFEELAKEQVAGVFVADRRTIDDTLIGVTKTIIGKAADLVQMRGVAMAEVAEMDVLMEDTLEKVFGSQDPRFAEKAVETLDNLLTAAAESVAKLEPIVQGGEILEVISNSRLFSSANKFMAIRRVAKCLKVRPKEALDVLKDYEKDIIANRNTLAHAKEEEVEDGSFQLRSFRKGDAATLIDERWMGDFRGKLRKHRVALDEVCQALSGHVDGLGSVEDAE